MPQPSPESSPTALPRPFTTAKAHQHSNAIYDAYSQQSIYSNRVSDGSDEFSYAFDGGERTQPFTHARFSPKAPPLHLVTDVAAPLPAVVEATIEEGEEPISMSDSDPPSQQDIEPGAPMKHFGTDEPVQAPLVLRRRVGRIDEDRAMDGGDQQAAALAAAQASAISALPISRLVHNALTRPSEEANDALRAAAATAAAGNGWNGSEAPLSATEEALRHLMPPEGVPMSFDSTTVDSASAVFAPISGQSDARPRSGDGPMSGYRLNGVLSSTGRRLGSTGLPIRTPRSLGAGPLSAMSAAGPADSMDMAGASIGTCGDSSVFHQQTQVEFTNATNTHDGAPTSIGGGVVAYSYTTTTVPEAWSQSQVSYATGSVAMSTLAPRGAAALHRQFTQAESASGTTSGMTAAPADTGDAGRSEQQQPSQPGGLPDSRSSSATVVTAPGKAGGSGYDASRDGGGAAVSGSSSGLPSARQHSARTGGESSRDGAAGEGASSSRRDSPGREGSPEEWLEDFTDLRAVHNVPQELTQAAGDFQAFRKGYASQYAEASAEVHAAKAALGRTKSGGVARNPPLLEVEEQGPSDRVAGADKSGAVGGASNPVKAMPSAESPSSEQSLGAVGSSVGGLGGAGGGPSGKTGLSGIGSRRCDALALQGADAYGTVGSNVSAVAAAAAEGGAANGKLLDSVTRQSQVLEEGDLLSPGSLAQCKAAAHDILVSQARAAPLDLGVRFFPPRQNSRCVPAPVHRPHAPSPRCTACPQRP